jgi:hypothetical protein
MDDNEMCLQEFGLGDMDWIDLVQYINMWRAFVNMVVNIQIPYNEGNFFTSRGPVSFLRNTPLYGSNCC